MSRLLQNLVLSSVTRSTTWKKISTPKSRRHPAVGPSRPHLLFWDAWKPNGRLKSSLASPPHYGIYELEILDRLINKAAHLGMRYQKMYLVISILRDATSDEEDVDAVPSHNRSPHMSPHIVKVMMHVSFESMK
jgi:hypothetical protein